MTGSRIVGIDLGGTRFRIGVLGVGSKGDLNLQGNVEELSSPRRWEEFVQVLSDRQEQAKVTPEGYAIAIAGSIEGHAKVIRTPNLPWLDGRNVPGELAPCLGCGSEADRHRERHGGCCLRRESKGSSKKVRMGDLRHYLDGMGRCFDPQR